MLNVLSLILKIYFYIIFGAFALMWRLFKKLMWFLLFLIGFWLV